MKVIIIGGNAAGMSAASKLKRLKPDTDVIVFEKSTDVSYGACSMPYNISDDNRVIDDLVIRTADVFIEKNKIDLRVNHEVTEILVKDKSVRVLDSDGNSFLQEYDKLVIATGSSPIIPGGEGFGLPGVYYLKTLEDGRRLKAVINDVKRAVIVGMGYIGLEMAESLRSKGIEVEMVEAAPKTQPWFSSEISEKIEEQLNNHEVKFHLDTAVTGIVENDKGLKVICGDLEIDTEIVIVAIGTIPSSKLAENAGIVMGPKKSIAVNHSMQTSAPDIYSAGDCADSFDTVTGERVLVPLALRANRGGWAVADHIAGKDVNLSGITSTAVFRVFDLEVARVGINSEEAVKAGFSPEEVTVKSGSRAHAFPGASKIFVTMVGDRETGQLLGVQMAGEEGAAHRINAGAVALHAKLTVEDFAQSDLAYAPPFGPSWDPLLVAANQLVKKLK